MTAAEQIVHLLDQYPEAASVQRWYKTKSNGEKRPIATPDDDLKKWLKKMNKALAKQFSAWPEFMHGGIKKRSYVSHARPHVGNPCVITIDIKHCFDSITDQEVAAAIRLHLQLDLATCTRLAQVLCFKGRVAQGFPTSNYMCNLYLLAPLTLLHDSLKQQGFRLTNYVDDIAVSGAILDPAAVVNEVAVALSRASLKMNKAKVDVMPATRRQLVCKLLVNERLSLTRTLKLRLLSDLARGRMTSVSAEGWAANLKTIDPKFQAKLKAYAVKKGVLK